MPKESAWIVTTSGDRSIEAVAKDLAKAGFHVDQVLEEVGSILGTGAPGVARKLRSVRGVADVSPDAPIDIGPPDSSDTW